MIAISTLVAIAQFAGPADLVIEHARIWSDELIGFAEFAAIEEGRFVYVGVPKQEYIGPKTQRIDARDRIVIPGMIDSHIHMLSGGIGLTDLQLREAASKQDFIERVAKWSTQRPKDAWITGGRYSVESWQSPEQPTKEWIDSVTGNHLLLLNRMDGHSALANSVALKLAGITREGPPDPAGGVIDRDPQTKEPTGILRESAVGLVAKFIPARSIEEKLAALKAAMNETLRNGLTAVSDIPDIDNLPVYERLAQTGDPPMRLFLYPIASDWIEAAKTVTNFKGRKGWIEVRGLKAFMDGSLGSRTAYMREPFLNNEPGKESWRGMLREGIENGQLDRKIAAAKAAHLQVIAHAIGDEANHVLLDALAAGYSPNELPAARCRSEHAQHLLPEDIARFGSLGVITSMQPYHKSDDGRYAESYIGIERCKSSYAFKSLLDVGAVLAFGSDWPVVSLNPFLGIEAAVIGRTLDGKSWQMQENITVGEALRCYTSRAAYACFADDEIGRIAPGYRADFVILDASPFDSAARWDAIKPVAVFVEGREAFIVH